MSKARIFGLAFTSLLLNSVCAAIDTQNDGLLRRDPGEHVILADCRDSKGVVSSQMAYYNGTPGPTPTDVSIVHTNPGQAALWINSVTDGLFTDTGVTFTATLGPKVAEGAFAGTGQNGYANFTCWQKYFNGRYIYDGTTCSQVYDCNHDPAPVLPTPINGTDPSSNAPSPPQGGVSQGAVVGIVVGVIGALLLAASVGLFYWYWRRAHRNEQPPAYTKRGGCCGLFRKQEFTQPVPGSPDQAFKDSAAATFPGEDAKATPVAYEMDGNWQRVEMGVGHGRVEIDTENKVEIDSRPVAQPTNADPQEIDSPSPLSPGPQPPTIYQTVVFVQQANNPQK